LDQTHLCINNPQGLAHIVTRFYKGLIFIVIKEDPDNTGMSVTNRIEEILKDFMENEFEMDGCVYLDSTGTWDGFDGKDFVLLGLKEETDINYVMASYVLRSGIARKRKG
jgi:hypothetical protein